MRTGTRAGTVRAGILPEAVRTEILLFEGFEELDAFAPFDVLAIAGFGVYLVSEGDPAPVRSAHGATVLPARRLGPAPELLIVPGGGYVSRADSGVSAEMRRGVLPALLTRCFAEGSTIAGVCSGAMLLAAAGLLAGRPAVTHRGALRDLAEAGAVVVPEARVVDDGRLLTCGGITAGIDLALWLVERRLGAGAAAACAAEIEYTRAGPVRHYPSAASAGAQP